MNVSNNARVTADTRGVGRAGNLTIEVENLRVNDRARITASTKGQGRAGNLTVTANTLNLSDRGQLLTSTSSDQPAGNITLNATDFNLSNGARISAQSTGTGRAGDITLNVDRQLRANNGEISTSAEQSSGGAITINAEDGEIYLFGNSDIITSVANGAGDGGSIAITADFIQLRTNSNIRTNVSGQGSGGNITIDANSVVAFDDSDILACSTGGSGGNIILPAFFGENYFDADDRPDNDRLTQAELNSLDRNDRVDINASGQVSSGTITTPHTSFIQNSLTDLPESAIDPDNLVANSCVVRSQEQSGTFVITGAEGLPQRPGDATFPTYPTGEVRSVPDAAESENQQSWKMGDPIVEPQGVYQLRDGQLVLSRECPEEGR